MLDHEFSLDRRTVLESGIKVGAVVATLAAAEAGANVVTNGPSAVLQLLANRSREVKRAEAGSEVAILAPKRRFGLFVPTSVQAAELPFAVVDNPRGQARGAQSFPTLLARDTQAGAINDFLATYIQVYRDLYGNSYAAEESADRYLKSVSYALTAANRSYLGECGAAAAAAFTTPIIDGPIVVGSQVIDERKQKIAAVLSSKGLYQYEFYNSINRATAQELDRRVSAGEFVRCEYQPYWYGMFKRVEGNYAVIVEPTLDTGESGGLIERAYPVSALRNIGILSASEPDPNNVQAYTLFDRPVMDLMSTRKLAA